MFHFSPCISQFFSLYKTVFFWPWWWSGHSPPLDVAPSIGTELSFPSSGTSQAQVKLTVTSSLARAGTVVSGSSTWSKALLSAFDHSACATLPFQNQQRQPKEITAGRGSPGVFGQWAGSGCILQKFMVKNQCSSNKTVAEAESFGSGGWTPHYSRNKMKKTNWSHHHRQQRASKQHNQGAPVSGVMGTSWGRSELCSCETEPKAFYILCYINSEG